MNSKRKIVLCSILLICTGIVLFIGIKQKNKIKLDDAPVNTNDLYEGKFSIDDKEFKFTEYAKSSTAYEIILKNNAEFMTIQFPKIRDGETWIVSDEDVVESKTIISGTRSGVEFVISTQNQTLTSVSFKNVKEEDMNENVGNFDIPSTVELELMVDYEPNEDLKNLFYDGILKLGDALYHPKEYGIGASIEIPVEMTEEDKEKLSHESGYALEYDFKVKSIFSNGKVVLNSSQTQIIDRKITALFEYIDQFNIDEIERSIDQGDAIIEIDLTPIKNNRITYTCTKPIKHARE